MPASIYQHAPVLQIAPAVGTGAHMAQWFTGDLTALLMKCCYSALEEPVRGRISQWCYQL